MPRATVPLSDRGAGARYRGAMKCSIHQAAASEPRNSGVNPVSRLLRGTFSCAAVALLTSAWAPVPASAQVVRNFTPRFTANDRGDVTLIGNTLMSCGGALNCTNARNGLGSLVNNNDQVMQYVDADTVEATFNSSAAMLQLPSGATVLWAGLYWGGRSLNSARDECQLSTPAAANENITATQLDALVPDEYQGYCDVTAMVVVGGNGAYMVSNVQSTASTSNVYAGWALVVAYRLSSLPQRNIVVWDGYASVNDSTVAIPVSGFVTPPVGTVNTQLGVVVYDGDLGFTGDRFLLNGTALGDSLNPTANFFNSSITSLGVQYSNKTPNYVNQLGFDIDLLALVNALPNSATSATISLTTNGDQYFPGVVTFVTDLDLPTAVQISLSNVEIHSDFVRLAWAAEEAGSLRGAVQRTNDGNEWTDLGEPAVIGADRLAFEDRSVTPGERYAYRLAVSEGGETVLSEPIWVTVPLPAILSLSGAAPNPS